MDLYYNNQKIASLPVTGEWTIGRVKKTLSDWLTPQGITNYSVRLSFNDNTELSSVVFQTGQYDNMNFQAQAKLLKNGKIYIDLPQAAQAVTAQDVAVTGTDGKKYSRTELEAMKIADLKELLKQRNQKVSGNKSELIERIISETPKAARVTATATPQVPTKQIPTKQMPPVVTATTELNVPEIPQTTSPITERKKPSRATLEAMKVADLKELLKQTGQKVSGNKPELIARILSGEPAAPGQRGRKPKTAATNVPTNIPTFVVPTNIPTNIPTFTTPVVGTAIPVSPRSPRAATETNGETLYAVKNGDVYNGFRTEEAALRWWVNQLDDDELEDLGLGDDLNEIDYGDDENIDVIVQAMENADSPLIEINMME